MRKNETSAIDLTSAQGKPFKTVFLSYRSADQSQLDAVERIAARLRFFSIEVVLAQWNLDYGEDIKEFAQREIRKADAIIPVITDDYNRALLASSGPGEEVRFEVQAAIQEKASRPDFQIIPLLLDGVRPVPPFDRVKCAAPEAIEDVITQLGLDAVSGASRVLGQRYRVDRRIEARGGASRLLKCLWLGILSTRMGCRWSIAYFRPFGASHDSGSGKEATLHSSLICTVFI